MLNAADFRRFGFGISSSCCVDTRLPLKRKTATAPAAPPFASRRCPWQPDAMARERTEEPLTQLATRIPKELHRRLKLYCVTHEIDVQDFVTEAIEEKLGRKPRPKKGTA